MQATNAFLLQPATHVLQILTAYDAILVDCALQGTFRVLCKEHVIILHKMSAKWRAVEVNKHVKTVYLLDASGVRMEGFAQGILIVIKHFFLILLVLVGMYVQVIQ
mmetsp:Transcript_21968/g.3643  ORF Transcript_21968/g.3643 Transcript_21968/m.3643 type:complete len:106 (+) Transcript_21968:242-559(+)